MTKKHYKQLAVAIGQAAGPELTMNAFGDLVHQVASVLSQDNPRFDSLLWNAACWAERKIVISVTARS